MNRKIFPKLDELKNLTHMPDCVSINNIETPKVMRLFSRYLVLICILLILSFMFAPWQQTCTGKGKVVAYSPVNRKQRIEAPITGKIKSWYVREGQFVEKGQQILEISDIDPEIMDRLETELQAAKDSLSATKKALEFSNNNLKRQKKLSVQGLSSQRQYELAQIEVSDKQSKLSKAQADLAKIQTKTARQSSQIIKADQSGIIVRILAPEGGVLVKSGDALATLVPETEDRVVELLINGNDLPLVSPGRKVRVQFQGWPAIQFSGVPSVAFGTFGGVVKYVDAIDDGMGNYRIIIFPDPDEPKWPSSLYLRQGVRAIGWVLLDNVSLGWELWRRLNGFPPSIDSTSNIKKSDKQ